MYLSLCTSLPYYVYVYVPSIEMKMVIEEQDDVSLCISSPYYVYEYVPSLDEMSGCK